MRLIFPVNASFARRAKKFFALFRGGKNTLKRGLQHGRASFSLLGKTP